MKKLELAKTVSALLDAPCSMNTMKPSFVRSVHDSWIYLHDINTMFYCGFSLK